VTNIRWAAMLLGMLCSTSAGKSAAVCQQLLLVELGFAGHLRHMVGPERHLVGTRCRDLSCST